jgi:hypothetical protein
MALFKNKRKTEKGRKGDGTVLGSAIAKGVYRTEAGSEKLSYFDPEAAPFRSFPNGKVGMVQGPVADTAVSLAQAGGWGAQFIEEFKSDAAVGIAIKLMLPSTQDVLRHFQRLATNEQVAGFLLATTSMPFSATYSSERVVIAEVDYEVKLNALANILLNDPGFVNVRSVGTFEEKLVLLEQERSHEVE